VSDILAVQVALTRAGFSVGAIDGRDGPKTRKAATVAGDALDTDAEVLQAYVVTEEDAAGVFNPDLPEDMMALGTLETVPYASPLEMIAERFRSAASLIERLNPDATFAVGDTLRVPNVEPMQVPALSHIREVPEAAADRTAAVRVSKAGRDLTVVDPQGAVLFYAPVSSGSENDPLPLGEWKVLHVFLRPVFNYNPDLFWDADPAHAKTKVPGGPNNPVGLVWIDLDKEHYGLHGTPTPDTIGVTQSHGCVRLTNWDALHLATLVKPGTPVIFAP
jgi:lipoprotein-anchoring transpeptidase ErfK/SrfK